MNIFRIILTLGKISLYDILSSIYTYRTETFEAPTIFNVSTILKKIYNKTFLKPDPDALPSLSPKCTPSTYIFFLRTEVDLLPQTEQIEAMVGNMKVQKKQRIERDDDKDEDDMISSQPSSMRLLEKLFLAISSPDTFSKKLSTNLLLLSK